LFLHSVIVQVDEKVFWAEDFPILGGAFLGCIDPVRLDRGIDFAGETPAQTNQSARILREQLFVDARAVMKTVEMRDRNQFYQIVVADFVACQQSEVISRIP